MQGMDVQQRRRLSSVINLPPEAAVAPGSSIHSYAQSAGEGSFMVRREQAWEYG